MNLHKVTIFVFCFFFGFNNVFIANNIAYWGGGIYLENSNAEINGCVIRGNEAFIEGAGYFQTG